VTLAPELAKRAAHVTILQRSPSYIVALPREDAIANALRRYLPRSLAHRLTRLKNVTTSLLFFKASRRWPNAVKRQLIQRIRGQLGEAFDERHFTPRYNPWDQRLCLTPNGDLFQMLKQGQATMVTDQIATFTEGGVLLRSGAELQADLIVTATGLDLQALGNVQLQVDGRSVDLGKTIGYKAMMFSDVPNLAQAFGYTNASWTLKCDLTFEYVCRLLNHMDAHGHRQCTPRNADPSLKPVPWVDFTSGYMRRGGARFPRQGSKAPWRVYQNYALDLLNFRFSAVDDGVMIISSPPANENRSST